MFNSDDIPAAVAALYEVIEGWNQRLTGVAAAQGTMAGQVRTLVDGITKLTTANEISKTFPPHWPDLSDDEAAQAWEHLIAWVYTWLYRQAPALAARLPECWPLHADAVDLIGALRTAWTGAYAGKSPLPTAAIEYLARWLPEASLLLDAALGSCKGSGHTPQDEELPEPPSARPAAGPRLPPTLPETNP